MLNSTGVLKILNSTVPNVKTGSFVIPVSLALWLLLILNLLKFITFSLIKQGTAPESQKKVKVPEIFSIEPSIMGAEISSVQLT